MGQYSAIIHKMLETPTLAKATEHELIRAAQAGDLKARNRLVEGNLHHAAAFALTFAGYRMPLEDLCSEASRGLLHAVDRFDVSRDVTFLTYAVHWMRAFIYQYILDNWTMVRLRGRIMRTDVFFRLRRELYNAVQECEGDREMAAELTAKRLGWNSDQVHEHVNYVRRRDLALDSPLRGRGNGMTEEQSRKVDRFVSSGHSPDFLYEQAEEAEQAAVVVKRILRNASPREREILRLRYLCDDEDALNLKDVSELWGVSRERVRQIEKTFFAKLHAHVTMKRSLDSLNKPGGLKRAMEEAPKRMKPKIKFRGRAGKRSSVRVVSSGDEAPLLAANG